MKLKNYKDRVKKRRLEALDRRLEDIVTLEGDNIPGSEHMLEPGERSAAFSRVIKKKLAIATEDVANLRSKLEPKH